MGLLDVPNRMSAEQAAALRRSETELPANYLRVFCPGVIDGHPVRLVVECGEDFEHRAVRWLERQRRANHLGGDIDREHVISIGRRRDS